MLLDPLGASACLVVLGCLLSPFVGQHGTMSDIMIQRFGATVGGSAAFLSLLGSVLWAGAQYKAILSLASSLQLCADEFLEPLLALGLLLWSIVGGLMADIWLDALSMVVVAPTMIALAFVAWKLTPDSTLQAEKASFDKKHENGVVWEEILVLLPAGSRLVCGTIACSQQVFHWPLWQSLH